MGRTVRRNLDQPREKREGEKRVWGSKGKKNDQEALSAVQGLENFLWVLLLPWVDSL